MLMSTYGNLNLYPPSDTVLKIFMLGGVSYNIGFYLFFSKIHASDTITIEDFRLSDKQSKIVLYVEILLLFYYTSKAFVILRYLASGNTYDAIRSLYFSSTNFTSVFEELFVMFIADPIVLLTSLFVAISFFKQIFSKRCMLIMIINIFLRSFISGGRTTIFELGVILLVCIFIFGTNNKRMKKKVVWALGLLFLLMFAGASISSHRHGDEGSFITIAASNVIEYFVGSFSFFDALLADNAVVEPTYGLTTLGGITDIFIHIFHFLGLSNTPLSYTHVGSVLADFREIGPGNYYNAMPTMYYFFYTDFRLLGVLVFPLLFGCVSAISYKKLLEKKSLIHFILYMMIIILVVESCFNWQFERIHFFMAIVYTLTLVSNNRNYTSL